MCSHQKSQPARQQTAAQQQQAPTYASPGAENSVAMEQAGLEMGAAPANEAAGLVEAMNLLPPGLAHDMLDRLPAPMALGLHVLAFGNPVYQAWLMGKSGAYLAQDTGLCDKMLQQWMEVGTVFYVQGGFPTRDGLPDAIQMERWIERTGEDEAELGLGVEAAITTGESSPSPLQVGGEGQDAQASMALKTAVTGRLTVPLPEASRFLVNAIGPVGALSPGLLESAITSEAFFGGEPEVEFEILGSVEVSAQVDAEQLARGPLSTVLDALDVDALALSAGGAGRAVIDGQGTGFLELCGHSARSIDSEDATLSRLNELLADQEDVLVRLHFAQNEEGGLDYTDAEAEIDTGTELRTLSFGAREQLRAWLEERRHGDQGPGRPQDETVGERLRASGLVSLSRTLHLPLPDSEIEEVCPDWAAQLHATYPEHGPIRSTSELELTAEAKALADRVIAAYQHVPLQAPEGMAPTAIAEEILRGAIAHATGSPAPEWLPAPRSEDLVLIKSPRVQGEVSFSAGLSLSVSEETHGLPGLDAGLRMDLPYEGDIDIEELADREPELG